MTVLDSGGVLAQAKLNINIDGSGRAYNWDNAKGLIHLCNAAKVHPAGGSSAVIPSNALRPFGVVPGTLGVAWRSQKRIAVPFVVSDVGPRIGEGSPALARQLAGLSPKPDLTRAERFQGQVDTPDVSWIFFAGPKMPPPYTAASVESAGRAAFEAWGGLARLQACAPK